MAGWSNSTGMPSARSLDAGPMPERIRMAGLWIAPAQSTISFARISSQAPPPKRTRTPTARLPSKSTLSTRASPRISRFARPRAGSR